MNKQKKIIYSPVIWLLGLGVLAIVWYKVFSHFSNSWDIQFHSAVARFWVRDGVSFDDISIYSHILTYPLYHLAVGIIYKLLGLSQDAVVAFILTFCNIISAILYRKLFSLINSNKKSYFGDFASLAIMVFMPAYSFLTEFRFYARQCGPNPLHNPTIIFVRPIGIATSILFGLFISYYINTQKVKWNYLTGFGVLSLLSVLAKPSYAFVFLPAMGVTVLAIMMKEKSIKLGVFSFVSVFPSLLVMLLQYIYMGKTTSEVTMHFQFGGFSNFTFSEIIFVSIATFPVVLILLHKRNFAVEQHWYLTGMLALLVGWLEMFFLTEGNAGNFAWGYELAISYATLVSLAAAFKEMEDIKSSKISLFRNGLAVVVLLYQVLVGVIYVYTVYRTGNYWI